MLGACSGLPGRGQGWAAARPQHSGTRALSVVLTLAPTQSPRPGQQPWVTPSPWQPVLVSLPPSAILPALEGFRQDKNGPGTRPQHGRRDPGRAGLGSQAAHPQVHLHAPDTPNRLTSVLKPYHLWSDSVTSGVSIAHVRERENCLINCFPISREGAVLPTCPQLLSPALRNPCPSRQRPCLILVSPQRQGL